MDASISTGLQWRKSSRSLTGNCVEVAADGPVVYVRDSKDPHGPALRFGRSEWQDFIAAARRGQLTGGEVLSG